MPTVSPVSLRVEVAQIQATLLPETDVCHSPCDLPCNECPSSPGAFVVEKYAIAGVHPVRLAVVDCDPVGIEFGYSIRRARIEGRGFRLRCFDNLSIELGRRGLIEADDFLEATCTDGIKETEGSEPVDVSLLYIMNSRSRVSLRCPRRQQSTHRIFRHFERDLDMALSPEVVYLSWPHLRDDVHEVCAIAEVAIMELELCRAYMDDVSTHDGRSWRKNFLRSCWSS